MLRYRHPKTTQRRRYLAVSLAPGVLVFLLLFFFFVRPLLALKSDLESLRVGAKAFKEAWQQKDYSQVRQQGLEIRDLVRMAGQDFERLSYLKHFPGIKNYYQDGRHLFNAANYSLAAFEVVIEAVEPFKEVLGFNLQASSPKITAEEKMAQLVQVSPQLLPSLKIAAQKIELVRQELLQIDARRYPDGFGGVPLRSLLTQSQDYLSRAQKLLEQADPVLSSLPEALGEPTPKTYLVLFQNDKELRPTGGFITAYALVRFERGNFKIIRSDNIYEVKPQDIGLAAPAPILQYLKVPRWYLRDANFSPDFVKSMKDFEAFYRHTDLPPIDGIVAVDTYFLQELMKVTGPIEVPGYNLDFADQKNLPESCQQGGRNFTSENVVCRLELYAERILRGSRNRKDILGVLMNKIVDRGLSSRSWEWPKYFNALRAGAAQKHVLFYFHDPQLQRLVESYNWAGRLDENLGKEDYLHVNDANLAGLKADMYLRREVLQEVEIAEDGTVTKTVTLIYNNPKPQDGWLNAVARNYVRVYVPWGSKLISFEGDKTREPQVYEDLGKTVFDNFILIPPLGVRSVTIKYELPFKLARPQDYRLKIQKQPGKDVIPHEITINGRKQQLDIREDTVVSYP